MSQTDEPSDDRIVCCTHCGHEVGANGSAHGEQPVFDVGSEDEAFAVVMRSALTRKIHVNCGSCGRGLKVSLRMAGRRTTCPACGNRVKLPFAGQEAERHIEELIAKRSPKVIASETEIPGQAPDKRTRPVVQIDESELAELATFVETDSTDDEATLEIPEDADFMHRSADALEGREILALNEAISAFTSPRGSSASQELPALQEAVQKLAPKAKEGMSGQKKAAMLAVAAAVCLAAGIWVMAGFIRGVQTDPSEDNTMASLDPGGNTSGGANTNVTPRKNPTTKTKPVIPKPVKLIATCQAVTSSTDSFAGNGFFPAGPGKVFCRVCVQVTAGDDKLELDNYGKGAVLRIGLDSYPSLGEPVKSILPVLPRRMRMSIPARGSRTITMLFELPQKAVGTTATKGIVSLGKLAPASVMLGSPAHVLPAEAVTGSSSPYIEIAPRNTKPLLSDPVMSAIQNTMPQKLSIRPGLNGSVRLSLGSGEVTGTARQDTRGLYVTQLKHNGSTLQCLLRFAHGGKEAILYLSEEPFHQLTFARPGWSKTVPVVPQGRRGVRPKAGTTPPDSTKPVNKPKTTPVGPRRPGFFGV
jgi:hypothetical protein